MSKTKQGRSRKKRPSKHKTSMCIISVLAVIICASMAFLTIQQRQQLQAYALVEQDLNQQIADKQQEQEGIKSEEAYQKTDAYIEDLARDKLGLVYDNEIIFKKQSQ